MVKCEICERELKAVTWQHLKFKHNMTTNDYKQLYPGTKCVWNSDLKNNKICHQQALKSWETKRKNGTNIPWNKGQKGVQVAWNRGLTKENDSRVASISKSLMKNKNSKNRKTTNDLRNIWREKAVAQWADPHKRENTISGIRNSILNGSYVPQNNAFKGNGFRKDLNQFFRSRWEANFARILRYMRLDYDYEANRFDLIDSVFIPDFYLSKQNLFVEIQGFLRKTKQDKLKKFSELYPNIKLFILDAQGYGKLENVYSPLIHSWEFSGSKKEVMSDEIK